MTSVRSFEPLDPGHPCDFYITFERTDELRTIHFTVDTEVSNSLRPLQSWQAIDPHSNQLFSGAELSSQPYFGNLELDGDRMKPPREASARMPSRTTSGP